jgi:hypothetical protein
MASKLRAPSAPTASGSPQRRSASSTLALKPNSSRPESNWRPAACSLAARTAVSGDITSTSAFLDGRIRLQDEGSQLVAELAAITLHQEVKSIIDACAAPGGKTLIPRRTQPSRPASLLANRASHVSIPCAIGSRHMPIESNAGSRMQLQTPIACTTRTEEMNPPSTSPSSMCRAAVPARWDETRRFVTACAQKTCRARPSASAQSSLPPSTLFVPAAQSSTPPARWSRKKTSRSLQPSLATTPNARAVSLDARITALCAQHILTPDAVDKLRACLTPDGATPPSAGHIPDRRLFHRID